MQRKIKELQIHDNKNYRTIIAEFLLFSDKQNTERKQILRNSGKKEEEENDRKQILRNSGKKEEEENLSYIEYL